MASIHVLIFDPQPIFRQGIRRILEATPDMEVCAEAPDSASTGELAGRLQPDAALVVLYGREAQPLDVVRAIRSASPCTGVLVLGDADEGEPLLHAARAGAAGFARHGISPDELLALIRKVAAGSYPIDSAVISMPRVAAEVLNQFRAVLVGREEASRGFAPLSNRELQILDCIARGMANKEIAHQLTISSQTVKNHITAILAKLEAEDRTTAVITAMRRGWVTVPALRRRPNPTRPAEGGS